MISESDNEVSQTKLDSAAKFSAQKSSVPYQGQIDNTEAKIKRKLEQQQDQSSEIKNYLNKSGDNVVQHSSEFNQNPGFNDRSVSSVRMIEPDISDPELAAKSGQ